MAWPEAVSGVHADDGSDAGPAHAPGRETLAAAGDSKVPVAAIGAGWIAASGIALIVLLLMLGILAAAVHGHRVDALDRSVSPFVHDLASPPLDAVMLAATFVGSDLVLVPLGVLTVAWLAVSRHSRAAFFVAAAASGSMVLNGAMKDIVQRPRPALPWSTILSDYSFPSGHSMNSLALFLALAFVVWVLHGRRAGLVAVIVACCLSLLIGLSRIYLGYHYLTDVVGGYLGAVAWLLLVASALRLASRVRNSRPADSP